MKNKIIYILIGFAFLISILFVVLYPKEDDSAQEINNSSSDTSETQLTIDEKFALIPSPTRPPYVNCIWEPYYSESLGVGMQAMKCDGFLGFTDEENTIVNVRDDGAIFKAVEVYPKDESVNIKNSIADRFVKTLDEPESSGCEVVPSDREEPRNSDIERYTIAPFGEYAEITKVKASEAPGFLPCGTYGEKDALTFFEYHPVTQKGRYVFVLVGQSEPMFDEQTIVLY